MIIVFFRKFRNAFILIIALKGFKDGLLSCLHLFYCNELRIHSLLLCLLPLKPAGLYSICLCKEMSTKFDGGVHEVDAEGVVDEAKVVGQGSAVAGEIESVDGVGD